VFIRDATPQARAEAALRESREKLRSILAAAPEIMVVFDADGRCREIVTSGREILGSRADCLVDRNVDEVIPEVAAEFQAVISRTLETGRLQELEYPIHHQGEMQWLSARVVALESEEGPRVLWSARDVTQRRLLEERIRGTQRLESLGLLAGGIAHDFNNLLVGILGHADLLLRATPSGSPLHTGAQAVVDGAQRAAELCQQLLAYSGGGKFVTERVALDRLARETSVLLEASISRSSRVRYELVEEVPLVDADATQMRQILMNLITNASEALGDRPGEITVRCGVVHCDPEAAQKNRFGERLSAGEHVFLEVADTGCGMASETIERIFDPFFTTKFTGRGLGLAAVLGIVRAHQGAIEVESAPGQGATFRLLLPAVEPARDSEPDSPDVTDAWRGEGTILIADDEPAVLAVASRMAELAGFQVETAPDGQGAVELFRDRADEMTCVILDLTMPGMDGRETLRALRDIRSDVRVIFSSGYGDQSTLESLSTLEPAGFIKKPYTLAEFLDRLREVLEDTRAP
jgi:PAS domain S-box-containing protein